MVKGESENDQILYQLTLYHYQADHSTFLWISQSLKSEKLISSPSNEIVSVKVYNVKNSIILECSDSHFLNQNIVHVCCLFDEMLQYFIWEYCIDQE